MDDEALAPTQMTPRRRVFVIDREYQWRYLSTWLIMTLGYVLIILVVLFVGLRITRETSTNPDSLTAQQLANLLWYNGAFVILLTIFLGLLTVLLSHRVAGPAYRLTQSLKRMLKGDFGFQIKLRRKDYLQDVASHMNQLIFDMRARQETLVAMDAEADRLKDLIAAAGASEEIKESVERLSAGLDSMLEKSSVPVVQPITGAAQGPAPTAAPAPAAATPPAAAH